MNGLNTNWTKYFAGNVISGILFLRQVTKMERPYNKWLTFGGDSGHLNELQAVDPNNPPGTDMAKKVKW